MFISKVTVVFFALLVSSVISAPVLKERSPDELELLPRAGRITGKAAVIAAQITTRLRTKPGKAVFWSGRVENKKGGAESVRPHAEKFAKTHGKELLHQALARVNIKIPKTNPQQEKLWKVASKVMAKHASGHTHAVLGSSLAKTNIYHSIEKPTLLKNPNVHKLTEHNAQTGAATVVKNVPKRKSKFSFDILTQTRGLLVPRMKLTTTQLHYGCSKLW